MYFSASQKAFYSLEVFDITSMPTDVIEISETLHQEMLHKLNHEQMDIVVSDNQDISYVDRATAVATFEYIRNRRNRLLSECDYTQMPDWPGDKVAWAVYRQALRDVTNVANPEDVVWPTPPEA
jgi:hypothetical protein